MTRLSQRRLLQDLHRAREALARAKANKSDPWRIAELQLAHDRIAERAMAVEFDEAVDAADDVPPPPRGPASPWPIR
jgi:hypothetical protein